MVHILHCTEYPRSTFAVMDSGNCLVADISFDIIMSHLKGFYTLRKGQKFEVLYDNIITMCTIMVYVRLEATSMKQHGTSSSLELLLIIEGL